jgi:flagellar hook-associated protein 1 FlgK
MIDELSAIVDVNTIESDNGSVRVMIGALEIVTGLDTIPIETRVINNQGKREHELVWKGTAVSIRNVNGELKGLLDARDEMVPRYLEELGQIARTLVEQVNGIHRNGFGLDGSTGANFFDPRFLDADSIRVNQDLINAPEKIAASQGGEVGDGSMALAIQNLRNSRVMVSGTTSINDYYDSLVGSLGVESHQAMSYVENYSLLVQEIENSRQSVQGVSLDEEMANMIKFQHAYDAAARVITTMDEALDVVISRMGIVGR